MRRAYTRALWFGGALCGLGAVTAAAGAWRWHSESRQMLTRLERGARGGADIFSADHLTDVPGPVVRYLRRALKNGQPLVKHVDLEQRAVFVVDPVARTWLPLVARQHVTTDRPGFIWDARISMAPLTCVYVRDSYVEVPAARARRCWACIP